MTCRTAAVMKKAAGLASDAGSNYSGATSIHGRIAADMRGTAAP